ncbi:unnamed protein product [Acanthoscelides obtectus]|uniref:Uncharacterized protein n=1 Tax=Acanthoscelides obtectus TaxID=200917 RepID=A0A9P0LJD7_ACAOB|nr:unnamed protein product [Acanthoscelides obtectus]CAK1670997.1 hypothetical protein AOBTE_LOCUS27966 [Acanthoscelides obtectus]
MSSQSKVPVNTKPLKTLMDRPLENQPATQTQKHLKNINLQKIDIKLYSVKGNRNGNTEVTLEENDLEKLQTEIRNKLHSKYRSFEQKPLNPNIKIVEDKVIEDIVTQNHFIAPFDLRLTGVIQDQVKNNCTIFAEVKGKIFKTILEDKKGRLLLGWHSLIVFGNNQITQCKNSSSWRNNTCPRLAFEYQFTRYVEI